MEHPFLVCPGWQGGSTPLSRVYTDHHARGPLHCLGRVGPRSEGRCAPALRRASGPHHLVRGWAAGFDGGSVGAEQGALSTPSASPTGAGDPAPSTAAALWCAGVACACGTMRASACATAEVLVARQHAVSVPTSLLRGTACAGSHAGAAWAAACSRRARFATPSRGVLAFGRGKSSGAQYAAARPGGGLGGAMCMPRGRGRRPRAVARSQTCEDHTTTPRWRARARIVFLGVGG